MCPYLQLQVLALVVPLEQHAAGSFALVEALQRLPVFLHLLHHLRAQLHHRLVVSDGEDQHVERGQAAFSQRHVALHNTRKSESYYLLHYVPAAPQYLQSLHIKVNFILNTVSHNPKYKNKYIYGCCKYPEFPKGDK